MSEHEESFEEKAQKKFLDNLFDRSQDDPEHDGSEGVMAKSLNEKNMGVLKSLSVAPDDVRNILLTANFASPEEAEKVAAAINEAKRYGCSLDPILDWVEAHCGVVREQRGRVEWLVRAMTHYELNGPNTSQGRAGRHWWQGNKNDSGSSL